MSPLQASTRLHQIPHTMAQLPKSAAVADASHDALLSQDKHITKLQHCILLSAKMADLVKAKRQLAKKYTLPALGLYKPHLFADA